MREGWGEETGGSRPLAVAPLLGAGGAVLLLAGSGLPDWRRSAAVHLLALAGLAGAGVSLLLRAGGGPLRRASRPGESGRMGSGPAAALLALLLVLTVSALGSPHPAPGFRKVWLWLCLAGWSYTLCRCAPKTKALLQALRVTGGVSATACAASLAYSATHDWGPPGIPLVFVNETGALAALALLLEVTLATTERRRGARFAWWAAAAAALAALVLSRSTAAMLGALCGASAWAAASAASRLGARRDLAAGVLACALVVGSAAAPLLLARSDLAERSGWSQAARAMEQSAGEHKDSPRFHWQRLLLLAEGRPDATVASRLRYGRATLEALRGGPLLGFGPGSVPLTFARHRLQVPGASPWGEAVGQLHSVSLQRAYESGFAGVAAFTAWIVLSVLGMPVADPTWARIRAGMASAVGAVAVAGLADALEEGPLLAGLGLATLALLAARPEARARERLPRAALAGAGAVALAAALAGGVDAAREAAAHRRADRAVEQVDRRGFGPEVIENLSAAARLDPLVGLYELQAAYATEELALAKERAGRADEARSLFREAERWYVGAVEKHPDVPGFASQAGNFLLDRGRPREAIPYLRRAVALDYYDPLGHFYLGEALRLVGDENAAVEAHARAVRYYPRLAGAALYGTAGNEALRRRVLERVRLLLIAEGANPASESPAGLLKRFVEGELGRSGPGGSTPVVLAHRFDAIAGRSRAWHLFGRRGFTMENFAVTVLEDAGSYDEGRWARVLEGLPVLTAARLGVSEWGGAAGDSPPPEQPARRPVRCGRAADDEVNG